MSLRRRRAVQWMGRRWNRRQGSSNAERAIQLRLTIRERISESKGPLLYQRTTRRCMHLFKGHETSNRLPSLCARVIALLTSLSSTHACQPHALRLRIAPSVHCHYLKRSRHVASNVYSTTDFGPEASFNPPFAYVVDGASSQPQTASAKRHCKVSERHTMSISWKEYTGRLLRGPRSLVPAATAKHLSLLRLCSRDVACSSEVLIAERRRL